MNVPEPTRNAPEQYSVLTYKGGDAVRVSPITPQGSKLDKWDFVVRDDGESLVLVKHIGGKKYHADHTVPDAIPKVVHDAIEAEGYTVVEPEDVAVILTEDDLGDESYYTRITVLLDDSGGYKFENMSDPAARFAKEALGVE